MTLPLYLKHVAKILPLLLVGLALPVRATDYYVSSTGNDTNAGTAASGAWGSINKVNGFTFLSGDRLLFEGGQKFAGTIWLTAADGGAASAPVVISSYGTGRATIDGGAGQGLLLTGTTGVQISALNFVGLGRKTGNQGGQGILITDATGITVDQVETSGFQRAGVEFYNSADVKLTNVYAHDNGFAGITGFASTNVYIGHCRAISNPGDPTVTTNHSGNGIMFSGRKATIEYCEAAYNGYDMQQLKDNGPVGIWCYNADQVIIQHCISHNNQSPQNDGGGFDFDGGVTNSVMQYNYAYENKCYGYVTWQRNFGTWTNNVIRYNISINNAGPGLIIGADGGGETSNCEVYNNLFYSNVHPAVAQYSASGVNNFKFRNNLFIGVSSQSLVATTSGLTYQANDYWFIDGGFNIGGYGSLMAWATATGQEKRNSTFLGLNADPLLRDPINYEKLTDPTKLATLTAFLVPASSPVVGKGLDLRTLFGLDPGSHDFYSNAIAAAQGFSIGVQEMAASSPAPTPPSTACSATGSLAREQWNNVSGSGTASIPVALAPSSSGSLTQFEAVTSTDFNYGARLRGYLCVPQTGTYTFSLTGDDESELYLSSDDDPARKTRIAFCASWTSGIHDYARNAGQQSAPISLVAGKRYYVEALHKQNWGPGYVSVAWRLPDGTTEAPIAGNRLSPYPGTGTSTPTPAPAPTPIPAPTPPTTTACSATGSLAREQWNNVSGSGTASIPLTLAPSSNGALTQFEAVTSTDFNYGARLRGYICPPQSGAYTFSLAGDDEAELWLSTDDQPANRTRIATCASWTSGPHDYTRSASQVAAPLSLVAGKRYYIEALHKQNWGPGYVSVSWRLPDGTLEGPIAGSRLSPYPGTSGATAIVAKTTSSALVVGTPAAAREAGSASVGTELTTYPNPFSQRATVQFRLAAGGAATLSLYDVRGRLVRQLYQGQGAAGAVQRIPLDGQGLSQGVYVLRLVTAQQVLTQRVSLQ